VVPEGVFSYYLIQARVAIARHEVTITEYALTISQKRVKLLNRREGLLCQSFISRTPDPTDR
jgi:hypothetical protein